MKQVCRHCTICGTTAFAGFNYYDEEEELLLCRRRGDRSGLKRRRKRKRVARRGEERVIVAPFRADSLRAWSEIFGESLRTRTIKRRYHTIAFTIWFLQSLSSFSSDNRNLPSIENHLFLACSYNRSEFLEKNRVKDFLRIVLICIYVYYDSYITSFFRYIRY